MNLQNEVEKYKNHLLKNGVSLSFVDAIFELERGQSAYIDLESFELHFVKYGGVIDDDIKCWIDLFLSKEKSRTEISFINYLITIGIKLKYERFKDQNNISSLKEIYQIIVFIERKTEFTVFEYIETLFQDEQLEQIYKLLFFNIFQGLPKEQSIKELSFDSYNQFKDMKLSQDNYQETIYLLENYLEYSSRVDFLIKYFYKFSKNPNIFYFIINHKKTVVVQNYLKYVEDNSSEVVYFLSYAIIFNQYFKFEDELISYIKRSDAEHFFIFLKSIILRFDFYQLNKENHYLFYLLASELMEDRDLSDLKKLIYFIEKSDFAIFAPIIIFILQKFENKEERENLIFQMLFSMIESASSVTNQSLQTSFHQLIHYFIDIIYKEGYQDRFVNLLIGRFHNYLFETHEDKEIEINLFFFIANLYLFKFNTKDENSVIYKIFKMSLKLFETKLKSGDPNVFVLNLHKIYHHFLTDYLKEHQITAEIFKEFLYKIDSVFEDNDLIKFSQLLWILPDSYQNTDIDELNLDMIGESTRKRLVEISSVTKQKLVIYPVYEAKGSILEKSEFLILKLLKIFFIYEFLFPFFKPFLKHKTVFKRDKNRIYLFNDDVIYQSYQTKDIKITPLKFYFHYNLFLLFVLLVPIVFVGFRVILDGLYLSSIKLMFLGGGIIFGMFILNFYLFYLYKFFEKSRFFKFEAENDSKIVVTDSQDFIKLF
ncbi:hypothetical protein JXR93_08935 [bacterium]|nr:hypothetical protein [bacterium]